MKACMQNHILFQTGLCVTLANRANGSWGQVLAAEQRRSSVIPIHSRSSIRDLCGDDKTLSSSLHRFGLIPPTQEPLFLNPPLFTIVSLPRSLATSLNHLWFERVIRRRAPSPFSLRFLSLPLRLSSCRQLHPAEHGHFL